MKSRKKLGDLLVEAGMITQAQLDKALTVQKKTGERLGKTLVNLGYITEHGIIEVLEFQLGVPHVELTAASVSSDVAAVIPAALAERYQVLPLKKEGKKLTLAMVDPTNFYAIDDVRMVTGCEIYPVIAAEREIVQAINETYGVRELVEKAASRIRFDDPLAADIQTADDAPAVSIVNSLISQAVKDRASDIHIEPQDKNLRVRFRIDGVLREVVTFPRHTHASLISRVKIMSEMDIAEKRLPQDGRIKVNEAGRDIDIRVSTLPTILGEKAVLRILDKQTVILDINSLGFSADNLSKYRNLYRQPHGMILVSGPTGSGKTTTLYSTLATVNVPGKNIITVEDPVEYRLDGINQVQVNPRAGLSFANGLRSILRQDPNIIMVGEVRDTETADIAVRSALTGHLVLSTAHTNDAPGAITRLIDMEIEPFLAASSVLGVVAQRLVRVICPECKQKYTSPADSPERHFLGLSPDDPVTLYRGIGCLRCGHSGYRGRVAIHEVMPVTPEMHELIIRRASTGELAALARSQGMTTMREDGIAKAAAGLTTVEEVMRVAFSSV